MRTAKTLIVIIVVSDQCLSRTNTDVSDVSTCPAANEYLLFFWDLK